MRPVAIRPVLGCGKDCRQILDPNRPRLLPAVEEGGLIGHVQIDWGGSIRDYGLCTAEMVRIGPTIVVIQEAEIGGLCFRGPEVARVAASMPFGPRDEGKGTHATRVNGAKDGSIFGLMLGGGAIVDDDDLDIRPGLSKHGL